MNGKLIAIVLIAVLVVAGCAIPLILRDNGDNSAPVSLELQVYGNADGDWKITEGDIDFIEKIISGEEEKSVYADANLDGKIDQKDIDQVRGLLDGSATDVWIVDGEGRDMKVGRDIKRIISEFYSATEIMLLLGQGDKIVGADGPTLVHGDFYFGNKITNITDTVSSARPNYELYETLKPDILVTHNWSLYDEKKEKLPTVDVVYLGQYSPGITDPETATYIQGILKAGYIFKATDKAEAYVKWYMDAVNMLRDKTKDIENRPSVLMTGVTTFTSGVLTTPWSVGSIIETMDQASIVAGAKPLGEVVLTAEQYAGGPSGDTWSFRVDPEKIVVTKIDYAFALAARDNFMGVAASTSVIPQSGYGYSDATAMEEFQKLAQSHEFMKNTKVYMINNNLREGGSGGLLLALYIAKTIYPDIFDNMDPLDYHQQYVDMMGIDKDVAKTSVFITPLP